ncbi:16104_t:CDS:2 [Entrophospora sp. SA101]|nr:15152_t:CDS:2 [Entrophospora sp. SA101]CAJ0846156.1 16104_t:CDS:2 [Entrophospora sp. SA101]
MNTLLDQRNNDDNGDGNLNNSSTLTSDEVQITITESALFSPNNIRKENDHIILNVGGIKYETYRSTLTSYPKTLLGTMFADRNKCLLRPINDNEYFIDRNGYVFYYIIEFYRTGKIFWKEHNSNHLRLLQQNKHKDINHSGATTPIIPDAKLITREELEEELHYFQIPLSCIWTSLKQRAISYKIDLFVEALRDVYFEILSEFETKVEIKFRRNKLQPHIVTFSSDSSDLICKLILNIINPFESCGYTLLDKFGTEIGCYLKNTIPDLHWELSHVDNFNWYCVKMFSTESFNYESILQNSCLGNNNIHHRIIDD